MHRRYLIWRALFRQEFVDRVTIAAGWPEAEVFAVDEFIHKMRQAGAIKSL